MEIPYSAITWPSFTLKIFLESVLKSVNYVYIKLWDPFTHLCSNFDRGLDKLLLKLGHEITSHIKLHRWVHARKT